jgi:formate dehydrogenase maturation protein FdhE
MKNIKTTTAILIALILTFSLFATAIAIDIPDDIASENICDIDHDHGENSDIAELDADYWCPVCASMNISSEPTTFGGPLGRKWNNHCYSCGHDWIFWLDY